MTSHFSFERPEWLLALVLLIPVVWIALRSMDTLGTFRRWGAIGVRCVLIVILVLLLAKLTRVEENDELTVISVIDRSQSIPTELLEDRLNYLEEAMKYMPQTGRLGVVDIGEAASITKLSSKDGNIRRRNTAITGEQSRLSEGIQMAMAIAPPDTASRILLMSDGNETEGDLREAAEIAAMNQIPIDVLPVQYRYGHEVIFRQLHAPARARKNQTISMRFVLKSTAHSTGKIYLSLNGNPVDLDSESGDVGCRVVLDPGTNVRTISMPVGTGGVHEFKAVFVPDDASDDQVDANNQASAITYVTGGGHILVVDGDGASAASLIDLLSDCELELKYVHAAEFPVNMTGLLDADAIVLVNANCSYFSYEQQELLSRYVTDLGGGLVMTGGPEALGAGGWIGSPVQAVLPVDLDPPQKKQMPKGALVLVIDKSGSMSGEKVEMCKIAAVSAVRLLSRLDLVGVVAFDGGAKWVVPLGSAEDKDAIVGRIKSIGSGGGTTMGPAMEDAFEALEPAEAALKHMILLTDGYTSDSEFCASMGTKIAGSEITVSTVAVGPEADGKLLFDIAKGTKGRFYRVINPAEIPKIFVKEAQVVRRALIMEQPFMPQITYGVDETVKGISGLPQLDGLVLTGPKGGLSRMVIANPEGDPVLGTCQSGLGRSAVFTSSLDSRWGLRWLAWGHGKRFSEQLVRWAAKPGQGSDCEVMVDVQGRVVNIYVEALDKNGEYLRLSNMTAQVIAPDVQIRKLELQQTGPGQYKGEFEANDSGSHLLTLRYRKAGAEKVLLMQTPFTIPFAPEFSDLTHNESLLRQVCEISGGRMIEALPEKADLFDTTGLVFPRSQIPLTKPLMLIWLAVFIFDVAIRRIIIDFKAIGRKLVAMMRFGGTGHESKGTLAQLKKRRKTIHEKLYRDGSEPISKRRYEASADVKEGSVPVRSAEKAGSPVKVASEERKVEPKKPSPEVAEGHIQQLLRAKKKAIDKDDKSTD